MGDAGSDRLSSAGSVIGRGADLEFIGLFLDRAARAAGAGTEVLSAVGAEFEANVKFAGLNQVLHPLLGELAANAALALLRRAASATPVAGDH